MLYITVRFMGTAGKLTTGLEHVYTKPDDFLAVEFLKEVAADQKLIDADYVVFDNITEEAPANVTNGF